MELGFLSLHYCYYSLTQGSRPIQPLYSTIIPPLRVNGPTTLNHNWQALTWDDVIWRSGFAGRGVPKGDAANMHGWISA